MTATGRPAMTMRIAEKAARDIDALRYWAELVRGTEHEDGAEGLAAPPQARDEETAVRES